MLAKWLRHEASRAPKLEAAAAGRGGRLGHPGRLRRLGRLAPPRIVRSWAWSAERNALNCTRVARVASRMWKWSREDDAVCWGNFLHVRVRGMNPALIHVLS